MSYVRNPKVIWNYINGKSKTKSAIGDLHTDYNNETSAKTESNIEKVEILSEFFSSVFVTEPDGDIPQIPARDVKKEMTSVWLTETETQKALSSLKVNKSPGPDGIHPRLLKELSSTISVPLALLYNQSIDTGMVPSAWKEAHVCAIYKKGNKSLAGNYRPVSLTSVVCKTMETLVRNKLIKHMKANSLFSNKQYGFISSRSITLQLLTVLDELTRALDNGNPRIHHTVITWIEDFFKRQETTSCYTWK